MLFEDGNSYLLYSKFIGWFLDLDEKQVKNQLYSPENRQYSSKCQKNTLFYGFFRKYYSQMRILMV